MRLRLLCKLLLQGTMYTMPAALCLSLSQPLSAQQVQRNFKGVVRNAGGEPVVGASVTVKGSSRGTTTAADGSFSIDAPEGSTLLISSVGYEARQVEAKGSLGTIQLQPSSSKLDEVVVVGYGTQRRKDLTGSVSVVDVADAKKTTSHD
ncbi:MAG TPA: carboxypeptidase-like regulatory domain-containing protein, partial [Flavisolibacter sp.]|nr:carboxypeptidase-like regulatory domain-containing protein [Flavisolibacter sp.]